VDADLSQILGESWPVLLEHVSDALIVLDRERSIRFVNERARRLLEYGTGDVIGGRCRQTTRGMDCTDACPLSFALDHGLESVEDFAAVYRTQGGRPVAVKVTVLPLRDAAGEFAGAVEILRPAEPDPGFYLTGSSELAVSLRRQVSEMAAGTGHLVLVGGQEECGDVARAVHRLAGLEEDLFRVAAAGDLPEWPPGTCYLEVEAGEGADAGGIPSGWRVIYGVRSREEVERLALDLEVLELPPVGSRREDLPGMVVAWVEQLSPGTTVSPEALSRLCSLAQDRGFGCLRAALGRALAVAREELAEAHLPAETVADAVLEEALAADDPLAEAERLVLREVLDRCCWRIQDAADRLGISRVTLWRKLRDHGIEKDKG